MQDCRSCSDSIEESGRSSRSKSAVKRRSTRSKVWEKVAWFTKKGKAAKGNEAFGDEFGGEFLEPGNIGGDGTRQRADRSRGKDAVCERCHGVLTDKARRAKGPGSFRYLRKRKAGQPGCRIGQEPTETTATGTFHDFTEGRVLRTRQNSSSNSVLNEIARGMQGSHSKGKGNVQSVLSLPLGDLSLDEGDNTIGHGRVSLASARKYGSSLWRSCSFSSPPYNSWPRKKRASLGSLSIGTLSPPQKQKRQSGLKKTATFSGFDLSRTNIRDTCQALFKGTKSAPHLTKGNQIRDQDGATVGVIHCHGAPRAGQDSCLHTRPASHSHNQEKTQRLRTQELSLPAQHHHHSEWSLGTFRGSHTKGESEVCPVDSSFDEEHDPGQAYPEFMCLELGHSGFHKLPSCEILSTRLLDNCNEVYNMTTLHRVSGSDQSGRESWSDNQDETMAKGGQEQATSQCPWIELSRVTPASDSADVPTRDTGMAAQERACTSLTIGKTSLAATQDSSQELLQGLCLLPEPTVQQRCCTELSKWSVGCQTDFPAASLASQISRSALPGVACSKPCAQAGLPEYSAVLGQFCTGFSDGDLGTQLGCGDHTSQPVVLAASDANDTPTPAISGVTFKQNMEVILQYFQEFSDEQKNVMIRRLLGYCGVPQMHVLSVAMEPILHKNCPPNCQDVLAWLPSNVAYKVLSYLDAVSVCRCDQVNKLWHNLASSPTLWKRLCRMPIWQVSRASEEKQLQKYTSGDGIPHWKKILAERFLLRQNWLRGNFAVRTFQGHTQGISCVQFDDSRIASGSSDKTIKVWDMKSEDSNAVLTLAGHSGTVRCLNLNGNRLVSGSVDRSIKVWDLSFKSYWSGASCKVTMLGHMHTVRCLQVDDDKVVSGSYDKTLKVWDVRTGDCRLTLRGHTAAVLCVQFDDRKIVSGSYDKTIKVWSLDEGSCLMTLTGHHDAVTCLNLTFDGRKVISGSLDHNLKFWDLATGKSIGTLDWIRSEGHTGVVRCLQSDSWRIVSAGDDKTMKMWSLETGQRLLTLRCHTDGVTCLQFNDFRIVSGSYDQTVKLWNFAPTHAFLSPE